jgi:threonine/homoserine/homoserine lactone efflux protein
MRMLAAAGIRAAVALVLLVLALGAAVLAVLVATAAVLGLVADLVGAAVLGWERARSPRPQERGSQDRPAGASAAASLLEALRPPAEESPSSTSAGGWAPKVFH